MNSILKFWKPFVIGFTGKTLILYYALFHSAPLQWSNVGFALAFSASLSMVFWGLYLVATNWQSNKSK